jgi:hypothetical protein
MCLQSTQKAAAVKATAEEKSAHKQAKTDKDATIAKETSEEPNDAEIAGGEEAEDSEKEEEGSAEISAAIDVSDAESSDDGDVTGRCVLCKGSKNIGKVSSSTLLLFSAIMTAVVSTLLRDCMYIVLVATARVQESSAI